MSDTLAVVDFSTTYIPYIASADAAALVASGTQGFALGYDSSPASATVRATLVTAGLEWTGAYRLPVAWTDVTAQINDTIDGIHASDVLPRYYVIDIEPTSGISLSIAQIEACMDALDNADIRPGSLVQPCIYSSLYFWQQLYPGYTGPSDRGMFVWSAGWGSAQTLEAAPLFAGFDLAHVVGHQYSGERLSSIGMVDDSVFAVAVAVTPPVPPVPPVPPAPVPQPIDPASALARVKNARTFLVPLLPYVPLVQQADTELDNAEQDLTPAQAEVGGITT